MPNFQIAKETLSGANGHQFTQASLSGVIDENADFVTLLGATLPDIRIDFGAVDRMNSVGVRSLRILLERLSIAGRRVTLARIAVPIVPVLGQILDGLTTVKVESLQAPYVCPVCKSAFDETVEINQLEKITAAVTGAPCKKCGAQAEFDDVAGDYFFDAFKNR